MTDPEITPEKVAEAINAGQAIVCYSQCWSCLSDCHFDPPKWHSWADLDDVEHARETGQPDPSTSRCACSCAVTAAVRGDQP